MNHTQEPSLRQVIWLVVIGAIGMSLTVGFLELNNGPTAM